MKNHHVFTPDPEGNMFIFHFYPLQSITKRLKLHYEFYSVKVDK